MIAIKKFRLLCADDTDMTWIFEHEMGKTNLYRYGEMMNYPWKDIKRVEADMLQQGKILTNNEALIRAFRKFDPSSK
jgi:hypothetical protein